MALLRQVLVGGYLSKDIETYGIVKITDKGFY
jgi:ATP-dependent DNA helicase RecQ